MKYFLSIFLVLTSAQTVLAQSDFCNIKNTSFKTGERLLFKVYYNMNPFWIHAGNAQFTIASEKLEEKNVYHIVGTGKTNKSYEWFYKVDDKYETILDQESLLPQRFIRNVNEGGMKFHHYVNFNHTAKKAVSMNGVFAIPTCVQDVLSAIYFARNIDYNKHKPGDKIPFAMFLDDKVYDLYITYWGKYEIETKYGKFKAIKITPLLIDGTIFNGGEKMTVWVSDDANHIPLRVESPILIGSIKVDMMEFENLRNPMTALIKKK
ncbi:MAG: DUF3108 domain-containing protein [Chitinophagaceae bacterium]|nr:DUF3108 domain-containing protein [Chitinophagaceae bacterium]